MKLQDENRIIVRWGLKQIPTLPVPDCVPWWEACGLDIYNLTAYHIGLSSGPCLNASGRLKTAQLALELLLCEEPNAEREALTGAFWRVSGPGNAARLRAEEMASRVKSFSTRSAKEHD